MPAMVRERQSARKRHPQKVGSDMAVWILREALRDGGFLTGYWLGGFCRDVS